MSYEWMKSGLETETQTAFAGPQNVPAEKKHLQSFLGHLEEALSARGYFRPAAKKPKMVDNLSAVLTRPGFSEAEIKVLRGVLASLDYFSPNEPRGTGYPARKVAADAKLHGEDDGPEAAQTCGERRRGKRTMTEQTEPLRRPAPDPDVRFRHRRADRAARSARPDARPALRLCRRRRGLPVRRLGGGGAAGAADFAVRRVA